MGGAFVEESTLHAQKMLILFRRSIFEGISGFSPVMGSTRTVEP